MDVDEPTAKAVGGEVLPMIFVVSKAIEYIKNQILDRVVSRDSTVNPCCSGDRNLRFMELGSRERCVGLL